MTIEWEIGHYPAVTIWSAVVGEHDVTITNEKGSREYEVNVFKGTNLIPARKGIAGSFEEAEAAITLLQEGL